ncbi:porin family protein [Mucilaginibacter panaciglaebae]|uniref:Outer membrane protein beta-barrel domain-containing protein n=1 Tax=Mucilaginibacter panaciglaebae TaxID=502331 RepID=A0ABP7WVS0_9SPHI
MKNLILSCAVVCAVAFAGINPSFAQNTQPRLGLKVGADLMSITTTTSVGSAIKYNYRIGVQAGVFTEIPVSKQFYIVPQFLFTQKGGNEDQPSSSFGGQSSGGSSKILINYLDIPVLFGFKVNSSLSFCAGPQLALLLSQKTSYTQNIGNMPQDFSNTSTNDFQKAIIGGNLGLGYYLNHHASINLNYIFDFQKIVKNSAGAEKGAKNEGFALTAGYLF